MRQDVSACQIERRRNLRLRHLIDCAYGLTLCCAAGQVMASNPATTITDSLYSQADKNIERAVQNRSPRLVFLGIEAWGASSAELNHFMRNPLRASEQLRASFLNAVEQIQLDDLEFSPHPIKSVKNGLGFDYFLPEGGAVHFNLYQRQNPRREGVRVELNPVDKNSPVTNRHRNWSLGVSTDFVRTIDGQRKVNLKPQLLLDLDGLLNLSRSKIEASLEYGHWYNRAGRATADILVAQAKIRMRF